jgi:hypothetical protein
MGVFFVRSVSDTIFAVLFLFRNGRGPQFEKCCSTLHCTFKFYFTGYWPVNLQGSISRSRTTSLFRCASEVMLLGYSAYSLELSCCSRDSIPWRKYGLVPNSHTTITPSKQFKSKPLTTWTRARNFSTPQVTEKTEIKSDKPYCPFLEGYLHNRGVLQITIPGHYTDYDVFCVCVRVWHFFTEMGPVTVCDTLI